MLRSRVTNKTQNNLPMKAPNSPLTDRGWSQHQSSNYTAMALIGLDDLQTDHQEFGSAHPDELGLNHQLISDNHFKMVEAEQEAEQAWQDGHDEWMADYYNSDWEYPEQ